MRRHSTIMVAAIVLAGCQTAQTPSGKPEITVSVPAATARAAVVGTYVNLGYGLIRESDSQVVMEEPGLPGAAEALLGPGMRYRIAFTFLPQASGTRVVADGALVSRPGTAFERPLAMNNGVPPERAQFVLDQIGAGLAAGKSPELVATSAAAAAKAKYNVYYANAPG